MQLIPSRVSVISCIKLEDFSIKITVIVLVQWVFLCRSFELQESELKSVFCFQLGYLCGKKTCNKWNNVQPDGFYHKINPFRAIQDPDHLIWVYFAITPAWFRIVPYMPALCDKRVVDTTEIFHLKISYLQILWPHIGWEATFNVCR